MALADGRLRLHDRVPLSWNFDLHYVEGSYTLGDDDGQEWCTWGGALRECACNAPYGCYRGRILLTPRADSGLAAAEEDSWSP